MNQALAEQVQQAVHQDEFVTVAETTLPGGLIVPSFLVGKYACSKSDDGQAIIDINRQPWNRISYHESVQACEAAGMRLLTETQALAIAYQISQQPENWTGGKVGEGTIYQGLHLWTVNEAQDGNYESDKPTERRWHKLANGQIVFDFSGNIYSWVFDDVQGDEKGVIAKEFAEDSPTVTTAPYPSRTHGIGYTDVANEDWSGLALLRGGCWASYSRAGVFDVGYGVPSRRDGDVGFRGTKSL